MPNPTQAQSNEARATLVARRGTIHRIQQKNHAEGAELRLDARERASSEEIAGVLVLLSDRERREVDDIDAALARMDAGTWGKCSQCGKNIGHSRLTAMPEAQNCLDCATDADKPPR
jgi:DnaK suppressor protein